MEPSPRRRVIPDKLFYKIGEVSDIAEVESYVLRYWESEFPFLKPRKNKAGRRVYMRKDLEIILQIKKLLYKEKYTIAGVRKKFAERLVTKNTVPVETIHRVRTRLKEILKTLK